jgi:hypothetical protein
MDILQDDRGKIVFINGNLLVTTGNDVLVKQKLFNRLITEKGTWFLDTLQGVNWFDEVFADGTTKEQVDSILRMEILQEPLVDYLINFRSSVDPRSRVYTLDFSVKVTGRGDVVVLKLLANENDLVLTDVNNNVLLTGG